MSERHWSEEKSEVGGGEPNTYFMMREKDPELWSQMLKLRAAEVVDAWRAVYPEDFPLGGLTMIDDAFAIKPNPTQS